ncbi:unnamed protein product [Brassica oleracea]
MAMMLLTIQMVFQFLFRLKLERAAVMQLRMLMRRQMIMGLKRIHSSTNAAKKEHVV